MTYSRSPPIPGNCLAIIPIRAPTAPPAATASTVLRRRAPTRESSFSRAAQRLQPGLWHGLLHAALWFRGQGRRQSWPCAGREERQRHRQIPGAEFCRKRIAGDPAIHAMQTTGRTWMAGSADQPVAGLCKANFRIAGTGYDQALVFRYPGLAASPLRRGGRRGGRSRHRRGIAGPC